ncbi:Os04g0601100 [Oryza sativa Japonica Group]|uniref:Os04g0601100 protein n=1 Tax=Oryza sativa subsp. japonica TaxID=39947 RepID=A0A0P0WEH2_ORYSJ|nr:Os04g0601100 [Oryza sativa Japonica Group]
MSRQSRGKKRRGDSAARSPGPNELTDQLGPVREAHAPRLYQTAHARDGTEEASASRPLWPEDQPCSSPLALTPRDPPVSGRAHEESSCSSTSVGDFGEAVREDSKKAATQDGQLKTDPNKSERSAPPY